MSCLAEASRNPGFDNYRFIYDNVENGNDINLETLFGKRTADRIKSPSYAEDGTPINSRRIEDFFYNIDDQIKLSEKTNQPFIYILDSQDGLYSVAEEQKFDEHKKAAREGKTDVAGSYGDGKAKKNSEGLRKLMDRLRSTESILIVISQTRDNIGSRFGGRTRSGGHALKFYAYLEIWSSVLGQITKTVRGKERPIGVHVKVDLRKNRRTGFLFSITSDIYPSYGIDDIGSCVDFLVKEKWWAKSGNTINATEFGFSGVRSKLIDHIETNKLQKEVKKITGACWRDILDGMNLHRQPKYND